jgi:PAS domain S-box-containing protein
MANRHKNNKVDITSQRTRAEESLRDSEAKYRFLYKESPTISLIFGMDGRIADANRAAEEKLGYSKDDYSRIDPMQLVAAEHREKAAMLLVGSLKGEYTAEADINIYAKDGSIRTILFTTGQLVLYEKGQPVGVLVSGVDVTERKRVEEALREAEEKLRVMFESTSEGIVITDLQGKIAGVNEAILRMSGFTREEIIGQDGFGLIPRENGKNIIEQGAKALESGNGTEKMSQEIIPTSGRPYDADLSIGVLRDNSGEPTGFVAIVRDVTGQKRMEQAMRESEERYRVLVDHMEEGYIVFRGGRIRFANRRFAEVMGIPVEKLIGENFWRFLAPESQQQARQTYETLKVGGKAPHIQEYVYLTEDRRRIPVEVSMSEITYEGKPSYAVVLRDVTERKRAEEALRKSEEQYRLLADNVTDVIWTMDINLQFTYISPSVTRQRGYSVEEAMALGMEGSLTPASLKVAAKAILEGLSAETKGQKDLSRTWTVELEMYCKDGSTIWTEMQATFLRDPDGQAVGILGVARDIAERKRAEGELRRSEQQFRALIENAQDAIVIVNPDATVRYESSSMERLTGRKTKGRIGKNALDFCHPDDITYVMGDFIQLLENQVPMVHTDIRYKHRNGRWRTFEVVATNLIDNPAVGGIVLNLRDITERKRAEEEIRRLNEDLEQRVVERTVQLQAVNDELEAFAYSVSHDLRAPLRSIDGFSQVLLEDYTEKLDDEGKDHLQRVRSASQRMAQLIDDLLNLSRLTRGTMRYEEVDLTALAQTIAGELERSQPERDVDFTIAPDLVVEGDAHLLQVALENLLSNAWKFTKKSGRARIELGCAETNGKSTYFVRDNGAGFDMTYAGKLFSAFQRLHSQKEFEGSGIGLATVQRIINRHGGKIWAEGAVGQGATFYFTL